jgi:hypothetical protein
VPPEVCEEMVRCIANQFITERNSGEVMSVGLNTVREVASRNPLAIGDDLLQDLTQVLFHGIQIVGHLLTGRGNLSTKSRLRDRFFSSKSRQVTRQVS